MEGVPPHKFKLIPGATPTTVPRPRFGPSQAEIINEWVEWARDEDLIERATTTSWSSRLVLAAKYKSSTPKSALPDGIRIAWAGTEANSQIQKTVPTYPDAWEQMYNYKYKFSADGLKQYWSIPLHKDSREVTAFWTPTGLWQFKRLVMGTKNAATVAQNAYTHALQTKMDPESYDHIANFADDFLGGADTMDELLDHFEEFLKMCLEAGITLNPAKIRIGFEKEQFFGLNVERGRITPAERNLDPIPKMTKPKSRAELRSIMGVFNQFSSFVKDYGKRDSPASILNSLMSTKVPWEFTKRHEEALEKLKKMVLVEGENELHLYAPNPDHPLILETDGSEDGWGAVLYQNIDEEKRVIKMWSKQWKTEAWAKKPPYHREAKAWMNGLTLTLPYAMRNKHPVHCWTDHTPLTWIKHTSGKGPVSQFIIDMLSVIDYEMHYIKGEDNKIADSLSRFPMLGPSKLNRTGIREATNVLLSALTGTNIDTDKLWFHVGKDTKHVVANVYDWRHGLTKNSRTKNSQRCYRDLFSESNIQRINYSMGIWAPPADKVTHQCRAAFKKGTPFACLVPNELVHLIAVDEHKQIDQTVHTMVNQAMKLTLLSPGLTWVIHGVDFSGQRHTLQTVYAGEGDDVTPEIELAELVKTLRDSNPTPALPNFRTRQDWIEAQKRDRTKIKWLQDPRMHECATDGLIMYEEFEGAPLKTVVPDDMQQALVEWKHKNLCHVGYQKVFSVLKQRFHFNRMRQMCKLVTEMCPLCNLLKARARHAHKHFRPKMFCTPRTAYGVDYYGVVQNILGRKCLCAWHALAFSRLHRGHISVTSLHICLILLKWNLCLRTENTF